MTVASAATSSPARGRLRTAAIWAGIVVALLAVGLVGLGLAGDRGWSDPGVLSADSPGPDGARALARTLAAHGVDVRTVDTADAAEAAAGGGTLVITDARLFSDERLESLVDAATDTVLLDPRAKDLRLFFDSAPRGYGDGSPVGADCSLPEAERAGAVTAGAGFDPGSATTSCYPVEGGGAGLLVAERGDGRIVAVDGRSLLTNERIATAGNAALGLNLLGRTGHVVWFTPGLADAEGGAATIGDLTPRWVTPAIVMLIVAAVVAGVWRGRRFGPLVEETLPVVVRGGETTAGRAHLYARAEDPAHAAELLRRRATRRLARRLGIGTVSVSAVADAVAAVTGIPAGRVHELLHGAAPTDEGALLRLADELDDMETALAAASGKGRA